MLHPVLRWPPPRWVSLTAAGLVLLAGAGAGIWWWLEAQAGRVDAAYAAALGRAQEATTPEARTAAARELEALLARHPSGRLAAEAAWELGQLRYAERDWRRARAAWEVAAARAGSVTLTRLARLGIASTWEAERDYARALESYQAVLAGLKPGDFQYEEALVALARVQELAGRRAEAVETYRRFLREAPQSPRIPEVRSRLAALGAGP